MGFGYKAFDGTVISSVGRYGTDASGGGSGRRMAGHRQELFTRLLPDAELEVAHHQREGMRPEHRADAVDRILVILRIGLESGIHRLFQCLQPEGDGNHFRSENLHAGHVGRLLGDIDFPHVNFTLQPKVGGGSGERHTVLAGAGFRNQPFLAHEFGEQTFSHAVIELMGAGMVEILPLEVDLAVAQQSRQPVTMINRSRPSLKLPPDAAQLVDEVRRAADGLVGILNLLERRHKFRRKISAAVRSEPAVGGGIIAEIT